MTDRQAVLIHALIYTTCYDITNKTKKVDKVLKQIKKGLRKLPSEFYDEIAKECHNKWQSARQSTIEKDSKIDVKMSELLMTLYNGMSGSPLQNMYYTDKSFGSMVNSFDSCLSNRADEFHYTSDGRRLGEAFLKEIGVVKSTRLSRMRYTHEQNLIIEGKR